MFNSKNLEKMSDQKFESPEEAMKALASGDLKEVGTASNATVGLGPSNKGWFTLYWDATAIGTYDWIGLYENVKKSDADYIKGNNWQWASKGNIYVTNTACQPGYEARYLIWDTTTKKYRAIAKTGAYPKKISSK